MPLELLGTIGGGVGGFFLGGPAGAAAGAAAGRQLGGAAGDFFGRRQTPQQQVQQQAPQIAETGYTPAATTGGAVTTPVAELPQRMPWEDALAKAEGIYGPLPTDGPMTWEDALGRAKGVYGPLPADQPMPWHQAYRQAQQALDPGFQRTLDTTLRDLDRQAMGRGFYGQVPADVMRRATAGDLVLGHQATLGQHAHGVQQAAEQEAARRRHNIAQAAFGYQQADAQEAMRRQQQIAQAATGFQQASVADQMASAQLAQQMLAQQQAQDLQQQQQTGQLWQGIGGLAGQALPYAYDYWKRHDFQLPWGGGGTATSATPLGGTATMPGGGVSPTARIGW